MSFCKDKVRFKGVTFDDVLLIPHYSEVLPKEVQVSTKFSTAIDLNIPIISAAMDTVTEKELAIAIAREGGIGVIHKNMSIAQQVKQVKTVKRAESGIIYDPITILEDKTVKDAKILMNKYNIGGIPVVDTNQCLIGILTNRDLRFENDLQKSVTKVMTREKLIKANKETDLGQAIKILQAYKIEKLPIVDKDNKLIGMYTYKDIEKAKTKPLAAKDDKGRLRVAAAIGITKNSLEHVEQLISAEVDALVVDTSHGHSLSVLDLVKNVRKSFPDLQIIAGNVATKEAAKELISLGVNGIKVGIGPGSICTTRVVTGVGVPQLTAIYNVVKEAQKKQIPVIADGGIRYSGDMVKALAAGADSIMAGSLLAGVEESPGDTIIYKGRKFKAYRGMGSIEAMQLGSKDRYFQDMEEDVKKLVPEGINAIVPFKGKLEETLYQLIGGLRAGMGYCGVENIKKLHTAKFTMVTNASIVENHPHDVTVTRETPNYSRENYNL